jgi:hypothetical protein
LKSTAKTLAVHCTCMSSERFTPQKGQVVTAQGYIGTFKILDISADGQTADLQAFSQLAWTQHPAVWLCESCAILWLVVRTVRSPWVRIGVLLMLCGLMLNALVTEANVGRMPVVGMSSTLHPASPMWRAATSKTRLPFLADQARLGLFSVGDLVLIFGGILIVAICLHRSLRMEGSLNCKRLGWILRDTTGHVTCPIRLFPRG